ncbi:MAG: hypothetical protein H6R06_4416, partial [Proteobacteria bacterium]|nr:hypothetical protein [Pseudomonadota bacterium]
MALGYGRTVSMTISMPLLRPASGADMPSRSPLCGMALPLFDSRAPTTTL